MEKRLILSIILSFFVLYVWAVLTQPQRKEEIATPKPEESTHLDAGYAPAPPSSPTLPAKTAEAPTETKEFEETTVTIENEKLSLVFSNKGGALQSAFLKNYDAFVPVRGVSSLRRFAGYEFRIILQEKQKVRLSYNAGSYSVTQSYELEEDSYKLNAEINIKNNSLVRISEKFKIRNVYLEMSSLDNNNGIFGGGSAESRESLMNEYSVSTSGKITRKNNASKFSSKERKEEYGRPDWMGFRDRFYCAVAKPLFLPAGYYIDPAEKHILDMGIITNNIDLAPGESISFETFVFLGPQEPKILKQYGGNIAKIVNYNIGGFIDWFALGLGDPAAKVLLSILLFLRSIIPSWGVCIILLACLVCLATYPLTMKGMSSMKRMQQVQPEMAKIKEKYKDNPQKYNKEVMELYKAHKINPMGGCLPMFIQMPIFFGVIQLLWRYVGLKGESFWWIKDLAEPDRLYIMPFSLPVLGNEVNILPIIVFILTIIQQRVSSKNITITDPNMELQQKMFKFMLPAMIILFFYKFASAIGLYFAVFYTYQIFMQSQIAKKHKVAK